MNLETVKDSESSKISYFKINNEIKEVHKEFYSQDLLDKEISFNNQLNCSIPAKQVENIIIFPYLTTLEQLIVQPIPEPRALGLMKKATEILQELKNKGIVHRDIKPGNLYLSPDNQLYISDFESTITGNTEDVQRTCGTPGYMAPEQYLSPNVDWLADQYSFGAVFYKILTGSEAFKEEQRNQATQKHLCPDPSIDNPKLKSPFVDLVQKMMNPEKEERFQSIDEINSALNKCEQSLVKTTILEEKTIRIDQNKMVQKKSSSKLIYLTLFIILIIAAVLLKSL